MKLTVFHVAQLAGWWANFRAVETGDIAGSLVQFGNLALVADGIYPDKEPKPSELSLPEFLRFVGTEIPKIIADNGNLATEFPAAAKSFAESMSAAALAVSPPK